MLVIFDELSGCIIFWWHCAFAPGFVQTCAGLTGLSGPELLKCLEVCAAHQLSWWHRAQLLAQHRKKNTLLLSSCVFFTSFIFSFYHLFYFTSYFHPHLLLLLIFSHLWLLFFQATSGARVDVEFVAGSMALKSMGSEKCLTEKNL